MFPVKVYGLVFFVSAAGIFFTFYLLFRLQRAFRACQNRTRELLVFSIFILSGLGLAFSFIPCFGLAECRLPRTDKVLALTFDDGPNEPYTSQVLDILEKYRVPATFFVVGNAVSRSPQTIAHILEKGHDVGNHTGSHRPLVFQSREEVRREIEDWERAMTPFPTKARFFRAPRGWQSLFLYPLLKEKNYRFFGWTAGLWDSDRPGVELIVHRFEKRLQPGMILLLHDGDGDHEGADRSQTVEALPRIIDYALAQGYRFTKLAEIP